MLFFLIKGLDPYLTDLSIMDLCIRVKGSACDLVGAAFMEVEGHAYHPFLGLVRYFYPCVYHSEPVDHLHEVSPLYSKDLGIPMPKLS